MKPYLIVTEDAVDPDKLHVVSPDAREPFVDRLVRLMNGGGMVALALLQHAQRSRVDRDDVREALREVIMRAAELRASIVVLDATLAAMSPADAKAVLQ